MLETIELSVKSPYLHPLFGPAFTPYPLFQWYPQSKENFIKSQIPGPGWEVSKVYKRPTLEDTP
jgi:hypothetical protein